MPRRPGGQQWWPGYLQLLSVGLSVLRAFQASQGHTTKTTQLAHGRENSRFN